MSKKLMSAERVSSNLGISKKKRTIFDAIKTDANELKLSITHGNMDFSNPWFGKITGDNFNDKEFALISTELLEALIGSLKSVQKQNFELRLERSIWQNIPVDFADVWSVAIDEIQNSKFKQEPDLDKIVKKIKKEHPNLFIDFEDLVQNKEV